MRVVEGISRREMWAQRTFQNSRELDFRELHSPFDSALTSRGMLHWLILFCQYSPQHSVQVALEQFFQLQSPMFLRICITQTSGHMAS